MTATAGDGAPPMFAGALPANPDFQRQFTDYENAEQFAARNSAPQRSKLGHLFYVGIGWATIVGGSISYSLLTPSKAHLLMSQRVIHARLYAQWATVGALIAAGAGEMVRDRLETKVSLPDLGLPSARTSDERTQIGIPAIPSKERFDRL